MKPLDCARDLPDALQFLRRMVEVNSFTANAAGVNRVGEIAAEWFAPLGFETVRVPSSDSRFGDHFFLRRMRDADRPTLALISHLDTVFPEEEERRNDFAWREEDGRIYGPGTNDIKGGTALVWMMLTAMQREWPETFDAANWVVALNACEEEDSEDFGRACLEQFPTGSRALLFEGDGGTLGDFKIVTQRKGRATFEVRVEGRGAHAGSQHARGVNAIVELARVIEKLAKITDAEAGVTVNVGTVRGGTVDNRVPHEATATLEMRAWSTAEYSAARDAILGCSKDGDAKVIVSLSDETPPWSANAGSDGLAAIWLAAGDTLGLSVKTQSRGGLSDGNVLWQHFPTIDGLGPCGDFAHCSERSADGSKTQEYVDPDSFVPKAQLNAAAIARLLEKG